jgi:hypothetical protein
MDNQPLDPAIEEEARALCAQITVAHNLDSEIQEELYGHVEDKIHGYLSGEVPVTEDDALILVREHFGDARVIKSLLQDVHVTEVAVSQWRRYTAATIVMLACSLVGEVALDAVVLVTSLFDTSLALAVWMIIATLVMTMLVPGAIFVHWRRILRAGRRPWYYRWSFKTLGVIVLSLALTKVLLPFVVVSGPNFVLPHAFFGSNLLRIMSIVGASMLMFLQCLSWIWWCDAPPRTGRNTLNAAWAWCLTYLFVSALPRISLILLETLDGVAPLEHVFYHGTLFGMSANWTMPGFGRSFPPMSRFGMMELIIIAMVAAFMYALSTGAVRQIRDGLTR